MVFVKTKVCTTVLEGKTAAFGNNCRSKPAIIAVNEGNGIALRVGTAEVNGVALQVCWRTMDGR